MQTLATSARELDAVLPCGDDDQTMTNRRRRPAVEHHRVDVHFASACDTYVGRADEPSVYLLAIHAHASTVDFVFSAAWSLPLLYY
jgi:hypothetical protein